jgi:hypothetical protein
MTSEIDKLKHFHVENYNGRNILKLFINIELIQVK